MANSFTLYNLRFVVVFVKVIKTFILFAQSFMWAYSFSNCSCAFFGLFAFLWALCFLWATLYLLAVQILKPLHFSWADLCLVQGLPCKQTDNIEFVALILHTLFLYMSCCTFLSIMILHALYIIPIQCFVSAITLRLWGIVNNRLNIS